MNWLEKQLFQLFHKHNNITISRVTFCKGCGSPFGSLTESYHIVKSYQKTERLNVLLNKRKLRKGTIRVVSRTDHTRLPDPVGLTPDEEREYQMLMIERFPNDRI